MQTQIVTITVDDLVNVMTKVVRAEVQSLATNPLIGDGFTDELWDRKKAADFLGISEQTLTKVFLQGRIVGQKSGRKYHFLKSSILKFLKSN
ncbi:MAG: hypothetical protein RLZZ577_33 [Bacteroidota bacterium]|jgi:hypothetical protein